MGRSLGLTHLLAYGLRKVAMLAFVVTLGIAALLHASNAQANDRPLLVFAAASLAEVMGAAAASFEQESGRKVVISFAGSAALARQIMQGAPADLMISANREWMDALGASGHVAGKGGRSLAGNELVLISTLRGDVGTLAEGPNAREVVAKALATLGPNDKIALGQTVSVPAGIYAQAALQNMSLWETVQPHLVESPDVRAALTYVVRGDATLGIVYATDWKAAASDVRRLTPLPLPADLSIEYVGGPIRGGDVEGAEQFLGFLQSEAGRALWQRYGYRTLDESAPTR